VDHGVASRHDAGGLVGHGDAHVGGRECAGVVQAIADHQHVMPGVLLRTNRGQFVVRRLAERHPIAKQRLPSRRLVGVIARDEADVVRAGERRQRARDAWTNG
jgi:hypothetical protein